MESTDDTRTIADKNGATIYSFPFSYYVEPAREFGIKKSPTEWVFILDADERITKELAEEVKKVITNYELQITDKDHLQTTDNKLQTFTYYKVPRKNIFGRAKWLKNGGWWPDHQMRLLNKSQLIHWPREIHSTPQMKGDMGYLENPFLHYFHGDLEKMVEKTIIFENIEAELLYKAGRPVRTSTFFRKYAGELYRRLIKHKGFLDGEIGIIESVYQAFSKTITYLFLYEKKKSSSV